MKEFYKKDTNKLIKILIYLYQKNNKIHYINSISKELNITYNHTVFIIKKLNLNGYINLFYKGRIKLIKLTDKGLHYAKLLYKVYIE